MSPPPLEFIVGQFSSDLREERKNLEKMFNDGPPSVAAQVIRYVRGQYIERNVDSLHSPARGKSDRLLPWPMNDKNNPENRKMCLVMSTRKEQFIGHTGECHQADWHLIRLVKYDPSTARGPPTRAQVVRFR